MLDHTFENRTEAGRLLALRLVDYRNNNGVVLALPRGGVVLGKEVAKTLGWPLDIVVTRKIGHPYDPEYAVCAVDASGTLLCDEVERAKLDHEWLGKAVEKEKQEAVRRTLLYRGDKPLTPLKDRTVIVVDDGLATGLTMRLAVKAVEESKPSKVMIATPVASSDVVEVLKAMVDQVLVLVPPEQFAGAVGAHYRSFLPVSDQEVIDILKSVPNTE